MSKYSDDEYDYTERRHRQAAPSQPSTTERRETPARDTRNVSQQRPRGQKRTAKKKSGSSIVRFFTSPQLHGVIGLVLILASVFCIIAIISGASHGEDDQSLVSNLTMDQMTQRPQELHNTGGPLGALIYESLFIGGFGLGTIVMLVYFILLGLSLVKVVKCKFWSMTFQTMVLALGLSILSGDITHPIPWGGWHGLYINRVLTATMGDLGRYMVLLLVAGVIFYVYLNYLKRAYQAYKRKIDARRKHRERQPLAKEQYTTEDNNVDSIEEPAAREEVDESLENDAEATPDERDVKPGTFAAMTDETERLFDEIDGAHAENPGQDTPAEATFEINAPQIEAAKEIKQPNLDQYDHRADLSRYRFPTIDLLIDRPAKPNIVDLDEQEDNKARITKLLNDYQIAIQSIEATVGPTVTLYEIVPAEGVRIAKIKRLEDDIALNLAAMGIRIIAPIPGKGTIGIEVPNKDPQTVSIRSILSSKRFQDCNYALPMAMGVTISNDVYIADLTKMPHLLVAGATGQGKSVGLNTIIASLLYKKHPSELKFVLIDPKMVEFSLYSKLERHYLAKLPDEEEAIITDPAKVVTTLNSLCVEMDQRYTLLRDASVRSLSEYNDKFTARKLNPERGHRYMPYIVVIVDEFADLIMTAGKEVETPIARIAQKARAVGMHMIIATQRPSTNVITGIIKANFPGRIAFRVQQMVDSKTILDRTGANQLIGRGDMLFSINGDMTRVQCAFIDTPEVVAICDSIDNQIGYDHAYYLPEFIPENDGTAGMNGVTDTDPLFEEAARAIVQSGVASTSSLQRRYSIGYNRAGKIMDQLEMAGIVGPAMGGKPRAILVDSLSLERILESQGR